jgi:Flp pilus assembly protein TadB
MSDDENGNRHSSAQRQLSERERFAHGLAGSHDPLAGFGGAPPALSGLTLRLVLAVFGLVVCAVGTVLLALAGAPVGFTVVVAVLAGIAVIDIAVIARRKRRGEPG